MSNLKTPAPRKGNIGIGPLSVPKVKIEASKSIKVIYPDNVKYTTAITIQQPTGIGPDWKASTFRAGCQDHLKYGSRRGNEVVPHRAPISMCVGTLKDKSGHARD